MSILKEVIFLKIEDWEFSFNALKWWEEKVREINVEQGN